MEKQILGLMTLLGVAITAFVTWSIAQRRIVVEQVTAERSKWRQAIRQRAPSAHDAILYGKRGDLRRLKSEFRLLLNPSDCQDGRILKCMEVVDDPCQRKKMAREFDQRLSLLLKHDWERAKLEAGFFLWRWLLEAKRHRYRGDSELRWWQEAWHSIKRWWEEPRYSIRWIPAAAILVGLVTLHSRVAPIGH